MVFCLFYCPIRIDILCLLYIMDSMLGESKSQKNDIKDTTHSIATYEAEAFHLISYNKTSKLITALYMITDIMDKDEPIRNKLRNLGANIISDMYTLKGHPSYYSHINDRISEILSLMQIASTVGIVSEMNCNIISNEFNELRKSIIDFVSRSDHSWLEEFMKEDDEKKEEGLSDSRASVVPHSGTRIGVQKGSTLLKALSDKMPDLAKSHKIQKTNISNKDAGGELKNKRREAIISIIKDKASMSLNFDGVTITDIKSIGHSTLSQCGEKTLQRELVSMVTDGILKKTGEKRWSKYSI